MTKIKITAVSMGLVMMLLPAVLFAYDMSGVIAYPVPFNPKTASDKFITVEGPALYTIKIEVFDINGDPVIKKERTGPLLTWNGRNDRGTLVKPGMYIIKVTVENESTGDYGRKLIRVLINY